ncbi:hypothetical protein N7493_005096 [Penicillium malachiteum]|uniref:Uncharacterized protein n=1 Tax=Penicillium malachiteum TaxID=1324776 RepID=A0AAD6HMU7_9EURO|nr:hypothetical protein N7493_005096 [Penicillium malachiteum]
MSGWGQPYKATARKGKQPHDALIPSSRRGPRNINQYQWPTLVIETGLAEKLPQLRRDGRRWFELSNGDVRLVVLLTPVGAPALLTKQFITSLPSNLVPNIPSLVQHVPASQQPSCAQEVTITQNGVYGAPLIFPFLALDDRRPVAPETDLNLLRSTVAG